MANTIKLNGKFEKTEKTFNNSTFEIVKIKVHGLDKNDNKSNITESAFNSARDSIYGIPIVAKYIEDTDAYGNEGDLTSHNQVVSKDENGNYIISYDTVPLGFISPTSNIYTEDITEPNGNVRTYIVADEVVLWKRYESTQKIIEWLDNGETPKVSMEIGNIDGIVDDSGYFTINAFQYESVCALGSNISPCFKMADIQRFSKQTFMELYQEMLGEFKKIQLQKNHTSSEVDIYENKNNQEGGKEYVEIEKLLQEFNLKVEDLNFSIDGLSVEDLRIKLEEFTAKSEDGADNDDNKKEFALLSSEFVSELVSKLQSEKIKDKWDYEYSRYSYVDYKENIVFAYDRKDNWKLYGFNFTQNNDSVTIGFDSKKRMKFDIVEFVGETDTIIFEVYPKEAIEYAEQLKERELKENFDSEQENLNKEFSDLKAENERLASFEKETLEEQRKFQENELFGKYIALEGVQAYEDLKNNSKTFSIEELTKELKVIAFDNNVAFSAKNIDNQSNSNGTKMAKVNLDKEDDVEVEPYDGFISTYAKKSQTRK